MSPVKGIVFDKDGTLFDFANTWEAWAVSFLTRIVPEAERRAAAGRAIGFDLHSGTFDLNSIVIAATTSEIAEALVQILPEFDTDELLHILNSEAEAAIPVEAVPLAPLLSSLRARDIFLGIATNDAERPARAQLDRIGVTHLFDFIAGFDSGYGGKPAPGQLIAFAAAGDIDPGEIVMVGDSVHDLEAGRSAGMRCVGVLTGLATAEMLAPFADAVLPDIGWVPGWIDGSHQPL